MRFQKLYNLAFRFQKSISDKSADAVSKKNVLPQSFNIKNGQLENPAISKTRAHDYGRLRPQTKILGIASLGVIVSLFLTYKLKKPPTPIDLQEHSASESQSNNHSKEKEQLIVELLNLLNEVKQLILASPQDLFRGSADDVHAADLFSISNHAGVKNHEGIYTLNDILAEEGKRSKKPDSSKKKQKWNEGFNPLQEIDVLETKVHNLKNDDGLFQIHIAIGRFITKLANSCKTTLKPKDLSNHSVKHEPQSQKIYTSISASLDKFMKVTTTVLDLNNSKLTKEQVEILAQEVKRISKLKSLILSNNGIGNESAGLLAKHALRDNNNLTEINLAYNNVGDKGARRIAGVLAATQLRFLNLEGNNLESYETLAEIKKCAENKPQGKSELLINVGRNLLGRKDPNEGQQIRNLLKGTHFSSELYGEVIAKSKFSPDQLISKEQYIVYLAHSDNKCHAYILVEGVDENGQIFIRKSHFTSPSPWRNVPLLFGRGIIRNNEQFTIDGIDGCKYAHWKCPKEQVDDMLAAIKKQSVDEINGNPTMFSMLGVGGDNCVTWAQKHLKLAGINADTADYLPIPPRIIKNLQKSDRNNNYRVNP